MTDRINQIIKKRGLTKAQFAEKLNVTPAFVTMMCSGKSKPSDRTIADICEKFHVQDCWLRNGEGQMDQVVPNQERLEHFFSDVLDSAPDNRSAFIAALDTLPPEFWDMVADFARQLADNLKAQENDKKTE